LMRIIAGVVLIVAMFAGAARAGETVSIVADGPESFVLLTRLARTLDHQDGLRILPIAGRGPVQSLTDVAGVDGINAAITSSDALAYMTDNGLIPGLANRLGYLVRLDSLDVHVLAGKDIKAFADLAGKRVAIASPGSVSFVAQQLLLDRLSPAIIPVATDDGQAVDAVVQGRVDAAILVGRRPLASLAGVDSTSGLHLVTPDGGDALKDVYTPALLTSADYPRLITGGKPVETLAAQRILVAVNAKRGTAAYGRAKLFAELLFAALAPEEGGGASLNLSATVPGWNRHPAAVEALGEMTANAQ
jgi:TRAP-type uncharacterized transport system substrate-binding protein